MIISVFPYIENESVRRLTGDVLSELDPRRQEYVLNRISGGQVFITCCENDRLDTLLSGRVFHVRGGEVL